MIPDKKKVILRQSRQRTRMLELLRSTPIHPTADWLYEQLKKEFPRLSLGTVYRNLSVLTGQGLLKKLQFGSTFDRFEAQKAPHYHLICEQCGTILDFHMANYDEMNKKAKKLTDFEIRSHRIDFYGTCPKCKKKSAGTK